MTCRAGCRRPSARTARTWRHRIVAVPAGEQVPRLHVAPVGTVLGHHLAERPVHVLEAAAAEADVWPLGIDASGDEREPVIGYGVRQSVLKIAVLGGRVGWRGARLWADRVFVKPGGKAGSRPIHREAIESISAAVHFCSAMASSEENISEPFSASRIRIFLVFMLITSQAEVKSHCICARRSVDCQLELPPATHVEAHAADLVRAVSQLTCHTGACRKAMSVLRHPAVDRDIRPFDRLPRRIGDADLDCVHLSGFENVGAGESGRVESLGRCPGSGAELARLRTRPRVAPRKPGGPEPGEQEE